MHYWMWFFRLEADSTGWRRFLDRWLLLHFAVGGVSSFVVKTDLKTSSNTVLLPLAGVFIGLCFAWAGNAQALLQTDEIESLAKQRSGGIREYVFVYQTAILAVMTCVTLWAIAGLGVFDDTWPTRANCISYATIKAALFFSASLTLRECWHVVLGAQTLLLLRANIKQKNEEQSQKAG
jgi:hypothetical protein